MGNELPMGIQITVYIAIFGAVIGVYYAFYKHQQSINNQLSNMYDAINKHIQQANIHTDSNEFVRKDMCNLLHQQAVDSNTELKKELGSIKVLLQELRDFMIESKKNEQAR